MLGYDKVLVGRNTGVEIEGDVPAGITFPLRAPNASASETKTLTLENTQWVAVTGLRYDVVKNGQLVDSVRSKEQYTRRMYKGHGDYVIHYGAELWYHHEKAHVPRDSYVPDLSVPSAEVTVSDPSFQTVNLLSRGFLTGLGNYGTLTPGLMTFNLNFGFMGGEGGLASPNILTNLDPTFSKNESYFKWARYGRIRFNSRVGTFDAARTFTINTLKVTSIYPNPPTDVDMQVLSTTPSFPLTKAATLNTSSRGTFEVWDLPSAIIPGLFSLSVLVSASGGSSNEVSLRMDLDMWR